MPLMIAAGAFVVGWILAKITGLISKRAAENETPNEHHQIRSLEASLRVAQKKADDMSEQFESTCIDFNALKEEHEQLESEIGDREQALERARKAIKDETAKVHELRRELTNRAEAKIRAEAHAKDVETELSVMQAGSNAMKDEVDRLSAEREDLSTKLEAATGSFEQLTDHSRDDRSLDDNRPDDDESRSSEEFLPDC
jgi:chromosome segregation ATPase